MKSYTTGAKRYWMVWSVNHKKKRELQVSLPLKKGPYTLHSVKYKSFQKVLEKEKIPSLCKSKKLSENFPPTWWEFAKDYYWL